MKIITGHMYTKKSMKEDYRLKRVETNNEFVVLDGPGGTIRRIEMSTFQRDYEKVMVKKTAS